MIVPSVLEHLRTVPDGAAWLSRLPHLVARAAARWDLELGPPFEAGSVAWTALARARGEQRWPYVVKVSYPHPEAAHEAEALLHWHHAGAPTLIDVEPQEWAMLMQAIHPGTPLSAPQWGDDRALHAGASLLARLHDRGAPAPGFSSLVEVSRGWCDLVTERAARHTWAQVDDSLVTQMLSLVSTLTTTPSRGSVPLVPSVLLHGDANPGNMLAGDGANGVQWFAIDPKPLVGDPAFDPPPLIEQVGAPFTAPDQGAELARRARRVGACTHAAPERIAQWGLVRAVETTLWMAESTPAHDRDSRRAQMERAWARAHAWRRAIALLGD
ncbi:aminoglycoside phosphotransferase family protein [Serinibacter salmoneus]|uniref:aminoglycoside phosphotransferase family protein n=1 Tax=Serinibacter salmoneus TaxID=556530 RepID=UPI001FE68EE7|nr:aminoglycoside phosphotransferase family protein [Serinibacter salmoneus]